jgi:23S rRNA (adenine2503-C2)-methyltransferase
MKDIKSMTLSELTDYIKEQKEPAFRAAQIYKWIHQDMVEHPSQMTNVPKKLIQKIEEMGFTGIRFT